jgi:N-acetylglucosaminyl-diphospho-decaprenol L-rhamnosyltransferase
MNEPMQRASLVIIIVSYNVRELLRACLQATFASLARAPGIDATVWVVDNASADDSAEMVAAEFPQVRLVASRENLGFAGGNNLALRSLEFGEQGDRGAKEQGGSGEDGQTLCAPRSTLHALRPTLVLLLNPDAEPAGDAIGQMTHFLLAHPEVGGVGAQLRYPDGRFQHGVFRFPGLLQLWFDLFPPRPRRLLDSRLNGRYPRAAYEGGRPFPIDFALGAALMVRGAAIEAAGLLDEGYFMYAEEVDWCWRMRRAGWPFYCVPAAVVIHHGGASTRQFRAQSFVNLWRSRRRLYDRFYGRVSRWVAGGIVRVGMRAEVRRVQAAAGRGEISAAELAERVSAAREVTNMFVRLHG